MKLSEIAEEQMLRRIPVTIRLPRKVIEELDKLVAMGIYPSRSEAIRDAIRRLLIYYHSLFGRGREEIK